MTPSLAEYTKTPSPTGGSYYILIEKLPKTRFFCTNLEQDIILIHFVRNTCRKKIFFLQAIWSCISSKLRESYTPPAIGMNVNYDTFPQWLICTALFLHIKMPKIIKCKKYS
jgi:hypothetical protein